MPAGGLSDTELMIRFSRGDRAAFESLVERHQRSVVNTIFRLIGDRGTAEDLAQEVFISIFRAGPKYKPMAEFRTWLFRIVRNECYNELRRRGRHPVITEGHDPEKSPLDRPDESVAAPYDKMDAEERAELVRGAISKLPPSQRMAVILRRYEGLSYIEIAATMDNTVPAVKSLLSRAKSSLAETLGRYFGKAE